MGYFDDAEFSYLNGKIIINIENRDNEELIFSLGNGEVWKLYHDQDCCESVTIEDICGDLQDLVGYPVLLAEEVSSINKNPPGVDIPEWQESFTWTFYKLSTIRGSVTVRWYGESNGYYSEEVDFVRVS